MQIGILGAPGAGKTNFAKGLFDLLSADEEKTVVVLDGYVDDLRLTTSLEYGHFGTHIEDMQVVFKRREWELAWAGAQITITCGTVLDSTAHCFVRTEEAARNSRELTLQQERLRTIASTFGLLYTDTWQYDYAFYLPYTGDSQQSRLIDQALLDLMKNFAPPVMSFKTEVPDDEKAQAAAAAIHALEAEPTPEIEESGVQPGREDGEADGDSSGPVPDVSEQGTNPDDA